MELQSCGCWLVLLAVSLVSSPAARAQKREKLWEKPHKLDLLFKVSNAYLSGGTMLDTMSTIRLMDWNAVAHGTNGTVLGRYYGEEAGWASFLGKRNTGAVVAANVLLNAGVSMLDRKLYRRGGHWRYLAITLNLLKGTDSVVAGVHNITFNPDQAVQRATGYSGTVLWSH